MPSPSVAIVILNWNGRKMLEKFLPSVLTSSYPAHTVYVADNGSTDDSLAWLKQTYPQVHQIAMEENRGYAGGYNTALKQVDADYYMILNSDVAVEPGWLEPMVEMLEANSTIGACQPKIRSFNQPDHFEYAGAAGGWMDSFGYPFCRGRVFETIEEDKGQYDDSIPIAWASGAALFVRSRIFHELGGFDPFFFAHQEEIDLCWRMQAAGYRVYSCHLSVVYHLGGGTLPRGNSRKTFLNFRNNLIMLVKNLPASRKCWLIPLRYTLDGVAAWKELFRGDTGFFAAVCKAHFAVIGWWLWHRKKSVWPDKKMAKPNGFSSFLLPWQYFAKKRRDFKSLQQR
jgi:GT2 family glycosyltransferase